MPGTCSLHEGEVHDNERIFLDKHFQRPLPARDLSEVPLYYSALSRGRPFTPAMSVIGCPHGCDFCTIRRSVTQIRTPEDIVDEMEVCEKELGIEEIDFFDAGISIVRERTLRIAELYRQRGLSIRWSARARIDCVDPEQLAAMRSINCVWLGFGLETGDLSVLAEAGKRAGTLEAIHRNLSATRDAGIDTVGFFMLGLPGETLETLETTRRFLDVAALDYVQISPYWPVPRTPIYDAMVAETGVDPWRDVITKGLPEKLPLHGTDFEMRELDEVASRLYRRFYFRPKRLVKMARDVRSLHQLKRYSNAGMDILRGTLPQRFRLR